MTEETKEAEANEEAARLLDGVMLTLRVEMAARRLTLDELARLRVGQILDLGCSATDPVALVVEGKRIATGELV
ncbi:FliM/FliN family flagellar motor C-terminal domain-containing protein, partial [Escherichia coli]|nr:FliM/FliN family flagellar motor C-terminal domain-containing protein [Escherichia coli]